MFLFHSFFLVMKIGGFFRKMLSRETTNARIIYAEILESLGLDPESINKQWDRVDDFLTNPPSGMETGPEEHFVEVVTKAIDGLPKKTES